MKLNQMQVSPNSKLVRVQLVCTCVIDGTGILPDQSTLRSIGWMVPASYAPVSRLLYRYLLHGIVGQIVIK